MQKNENKKEEKKKRYEQLKYRNSHIISVLMQYWSAKKSEKETGGKRNGRKTD